MKSTFLWITWLVLFLIGTAYFVGTMMAGEDKSQFLIGESTYGHYQIEMACQTCHTSPFGGDEVLQDACTQCHGEELEAAHDSHPKSKFNDPRNANLLEVIDARYCISCHAEHQKEHTIDMGLTLPKDYCYHCHQEIGDDRESHQGLAYDSCASAGCHNYHDNRALYEKFLVANAGDSWLLTEYPRLKQGKENDPILKAALAAVEEKPSLTINEANAPPQYQDPTIIEEWHNDIHATRGINCLDCHGAQANNDPSWIEKPNYAQCKNCHSNEVVGFLAGKHGMRLNGDLSASLTPISPQNAQLEFTADSQTIEHGCNSCHGAHSFDTLTASVDACLGCHSDKHSTSFLDSPHGKLWLENKTNDIFESVSCATCHMPRLEKKIGGETYFHVQHNQNDNLRPNEKMIRPVCLECHGLEFAINALADEKLIENNFNGQPEKNIDSVDWSLKRAEK